ncbi:MAG: LuxR family transcriptional regulator, partial [Nostocaceae cyanobacterium]|nr:LuxR family transcriptional regulator [Nostocaceae cyanobacterium]
MSKLEESFVKEIASRQGVTKTELEVLLLALDENSGSQIAESLKISEAAVRKRLGESYRKFSIEGGGNKKLHHLK